MSSSSACSRTSAALIDLASGSRVTVKKEEPRWCWPKEELIEETKPDVKNIFQEPLLQWKELPNKGEIRFPRFTQEALESIQEDENELMCSEYSHVRPRKSSQNSFRILIFFLKPLSSPQPRFWKILEPFELSLLPTIERARGELDEGRMDDDFVDSDQEECVYEDRTFLRRQRPHKRRERSNRSYSSGKEYSGSRGCRTRSRLPPR